MIYVFTCVLNGFDNLRPPVAPPEDGVRYICFTNVPNLPRVHPWEYRPAYPGCGDPARISRVPKILPHLMLPPDAEYSIYHDGNFRLKLAPSEIIDTVLGDKHDWAAYKHPCRNCVYEEAKVLLTDKSCEEWRAQKLNRVPDIEKEISEYRSMGFPANQGLWANGFIARRHTIEVRDLNETWWKLFAAGSERDQLSFPVARGICDLPIASIEGNILQTRSLQFNWHAAWKDKEDNPDFWPERKRTRERLNRLAELTGCKTVSFLEP